MPANDLPPRFFKVFISHFSSDSMLIPLSYYDELPRPLPETVILQGSSGGIWNMKLKIEQDGVYLGQGWSKLVRDNSLTDGDFLTFVYNRDRIFEVSIFRHDACKEIGEVSEVDDGKQDSVCSITSDDTNTCSESETIPRSKNKGKLEEEVVEDSDDEEGSVYSLSNEDTDIDTCSQVKITNKIQRSMTKGKKKMEVVKFSDEDSDNDYIESFDGLDLEENSYSDSSYSTDSEEDAATHAKPKVTNPKKKRKSKSIDDKDAISGGSCSVEVPKRSKLVAKIKNPEAYLDDPKNLYFETNVKSRKYELFVHAQLVKDYNLKFTKHVEYIDEIGSVEGRTTKWEDGRVCFKRWKLICERNELKKEDRILCELLRKKNLVYAIRVHIVRGKDL